MGDNIAVWQLVFQNAAVTEDCFCRSDIGTVASDKGASDAELVTFLQSQGEHFNGISFSAEGGANAVTDMPAMFEQAIV